MQYNEGNHETQALGHKCYKLAGFVSFQKKDGQLMKLNGKQRMVQQSKQWLSDALIELMATEDFEDISITEIAQKADLSRKTFYRLFKNKNAVVDFFCDQLFDDYFQVLIKQTPQPAAAMLDTTLNIFFNFWWQQKSLVRLLIRQGLFDHLTAVWQRKAIPRYGNFIAPWHLQGTPKEVNYIMAFQLGGFTNTLRVWLDQADPEEPAVIQKTMIAAIHQLSASLKA
ncbi:transcriptional regulator [Agrilactobacillus composti DSM 18527 = JCM 14202]|uniref:Transcriptional regulator n=1 Tax=Agrilactobacillus composti DSM 18527 = JCM 14202 TaxID=1423734 RepID=A0A0R1Y2D8_9LACO|nr:transcriptional regulator [Agrilactobacillus composti DSM 18527 = JCM 14202]